MKLSSVSENGARSDPVTSRPGWNSASAAVVSLNRLPLDDQLVGLVAEQPAERDREQHAEQRQVEEQVADLAQVALLGRDPVAGVAGGGPPQPEPLPAEDRGGRVDRRLRRQRGRVASPSAAAAPGSSARAAAASAPSRPA